MEDFWSGANPRRKLAVRLAHRFVGNAPGQSISGVRSQLHHGFGSPPPAVFCSALDVFVILLAPRSSNAYAFGFYDIHISSSTDSKRYCSCSATAYSRVGDSNPLSRLIPGFKALGSAFSSIKRAFTTIPLRFDTEGLDRTSRQTFSNVDSTPTTGLWQQL